MNRLFSIIALLPSSPPVAFAVVLKATILFPSELDPVDLYQIFLTSQGVVYQDNLRQMHCLQIAIIASFRGS